MVKSNLTNSPEIMFCNLTTREEPAHGSESSGRFLHSSEMFHFLLIHSYGTSAKS